MEDLNKKAVTQDENEAEFNKIISACKNSGLNKEQTLKLLNELGYEQELEEKSTETKQIKKEDNVETDGKTEKF